MTSETDDKTGRRPPTIELAATEVDGSADKPATGEAEAGTSGAAETVSSNAAAHGASGRRFASHIVGALVGAAVMATAAATLWFTGIIPSRETAPAATAASDTS
ncbi:MAG: hypothetical protein WBO12_03530, partial [Xanthobacteraceae bacterium]